jgi:hypothetical protein
MASQRKQVKQSPQRQLDVGRTFECRRSCLLRCVEAGGEIVRGYFGRVIHPRQKEAASSVVCDADLASEKCILGIIHSHFPGDNIIAEESGRLWRDAVNRQYAILGASVDLHSKLARLASGFAC